jgi:hypothetical protein
MSDEVKDINARFVCCEKETRGIVTHRKFSVKSRSLRALKVCAAFAGITALFLFIPGAHFVLVPLGLLSTPIVTLFAYLKKEQIDGGRGGCPVCDANIPVGTMRYCKVLVESCPSCRRAIDIVLV